MLTQNQKDKLEPLTNHPKFGKLLSAAIKTWENINPKQFTFCDDYRNCKNCCLVGASVLNEYMSFENIESAITLAHENFNITEYDVITLSDGFDNNPSYEAEGYKFGKAVADIVIGVK